MDLIIEMNATMPKTDYCEFALRRV